MAGMSAVEDAAKVLSAHRSPGWEDRSEAGTPECSCGHDLGMSQSWDEHAAAVLADAGLLRPDGDTDHAACHEHADVIADQRNAVIRHGRVPAPDDEHTSDGRCKYPMTCATARPDGDTRTEWATSVRDRSGIRPRPVPDENFAWRYAALGALVYRREVTSYPDIVTPWVEVPS